MGDFLKGSVQFDVIGIIFFPINTQHISVYCAVYVLECWYIGNMNTSDFKFQIPSEIINMYFFAIKKRFLQTCTLI